MATILTKDMREECAQAVLQATTIPARAKVLMARVKALVKEQIMAARPFGFYERTKDTPREWLESRSSLGLACYTDPARPLYLAGLYSESRSELDDPVPVAANTPCRLGASGEEDLFGPLYAEAEALAEEANTKKAEILAFLRSMRTVEKVVAAMPELEPYLPKKAEKSYPVAPSNLLASLSKSGFDINAS